MSEKQIKKDLEELYLGADTKKLVKEYYKKKKKEMVILFFAGIFLFVLLFFSDHKDLNLEEGNIISRNKVHSTKKEIPLKVRREGKQWEEVELSLGEKEYTEEELLQQYE